MSSFYKAFPLPVLLLATALLSACDIGGIGEGNKLEEIDIQRTTALIDRSSNVSYVCFTDKLSVVGTFTDGGQADYSARAEWTSSNPSVVEVSNGDILVPGSTTTAFASGTIVPRSAGTAMVSAEFVGLSASYQVEVRRLPDDAIAITASELTLAPETIGTLGLSATVDGYLLDVTLGATWSFTEADDEIATINAAGTIAAQAVGGPLRARAEFPLCDAADGADALAFEADVTVAELAGLVLEREFVDAPNNELIVGTTEKFRVTGSFASGATQDLSAQVAIESDDDEVATSLAIIPNLVSALTAGTVTLKAVYGGDDGNNAEDDTDPPLVESNVVALNTVAGELQDFTIAPLNETVTALGSVQYSAIGQFSVSGETRVQPITRGVVWGVRTTDDAATGEVLVSSALGSAGLAVSQVPRAGSYTVSATRGSGDAAIKRDTVLCVVTPGTEATECPPADEETQP